MKNPHSFPSRHKALHEARRWHPVVRRLLEDEHGERTLSKERWEIIGARLTQGDPLADAVVEWMQGVRQRSVALERALEGESLEVVEKSAAARTFLEQVSIVPDWVDFDLIELGGRFIDSTHPAPYYVLRDMGLLAGYTWSDLNYPLVLTGALRAGATRRVMQTMSWFSDTVDPHALLPGAQGYLATLKVRLLHATVRRHLLNRPDWPLEERGIPINQTDMAATWLAFSALLLFGLRLVGVPVSRHQSHAVMHLWKYACWLMGVDLSWLTDDEQVGRTLLFDILSTYRGADETSVALATALADQTAELRFSSHDTFNALLWRVERSRHLGTAQLFLGPRGMKRLGLSRWHLPWYPLGVFGYNQLRGRLVACSSRYHDRVAMNGMKARHQLVEMHRRACGQRPLSSP